MSVQEYTPDVECSDAWPEAADIASCQAVLDEMTTDQLPIAFGPRGTMEVNVGLPLGLRSGENPFSALD